MRTGLSMAAVAAVATFGVGIGSAGDEPAAPDPAALAATALAKVDETLFFPDSQPGLAGYDVAVGFATGTEAPAPIGYLHVDSVAGTRRWTDATGKDVPDGAWNFGGSAALEEPLRFLFDLFLSPLSKRFDAERFDRTAVAAGKGWAVVLARKSATEGPATGLGLIVGDDGVPTKCLLALGPGRRGRVFLDVQFQAEGARKRIVEIRDGPDPFGSCLSFEWAKEGDFTLLRAVRWTGFPQVFEAKPSSPAGWPATGAFTLRFEPYTVKVPTPPAPDNAYVGDGTCKKCHMKQYLSWKKTALARALDALKPTDEAANAELFAIKKAGNVDPAHDYSSDPKCVKCHVTGYGLPGGYPKDPAADDDARDRASRLGSVSCEVCHGPGAAYVEFKQKQRAASVKVEVKDLAAYGLVKPDEATCRRCHNDESPVKKPFVYEEAKAKVHEHPK